MCGVWGVGCGGVGGGWGEGVGGGVEMVVDRTFSTNPPWHCCFDVVMLESSCLVSSTLIYVMPVTGIFVFSCSAKNL